MRRRRFLWMVFCCALGLIPAGELRAEARHLPEPPKVASASTQQPEAPAHESATCAVPARRAWTKTDLTVQPGTPIHLEADGKAQMVGWRVWDWLSGSEVDRWVGPQGTYRWPRHYRMRDPNATFPLPAMADGPFPAFCLIGKIGETGQPFYVGSRYDGTASTAGRLWLGINDDTFQDNAGAFQASIQLVAHPASIPQEPPVIQPGSYAGTPVPHARVLLIYVDGLRPDVVQELAEAGFLPNFKRTFLDRGLVAPYAFTVFPSNTLIANGSLFTGRFSDRTGIKSQNQFERSTLKLTGQLSAWLPDGFMPKPTTRVLNLLDKYAPENTHAFLVKRGIPTLATYLSKAYAFTTLPIAPLNPPPQWFHRALNTLGPFGISSRLPWGLDAVNGEYAVEDLIGNPDARVVAIWFPMVDKTSHHSGHGQFGAARRDLVLVDDWLGRILRRLREVGWESSTYLIVVSDHGHVGGTRDINRPCHLPRDWAHRALGWSAKVVGQEWIHPGIRASQFVFFDNQGAGQAKLFLPFGSYFDGEWKRNRLYELTHYEARPAQRAVNLLESLKAFRPPGWDGQGGAPVDLILVKLDPQRVFVYRDEVCQAIIHRQIEPSGREVYRYEPVRHLTQSTDGELHEEPPQPGVDPFGYLQDPHFLAYTTARDPSTPGQVGGFRWLAQPHDAREWLFATSQARYPDAVVAMAKFFAWREPVADLAELRDPDLLVTASEGWSFRSDDGEGTDHGYPLFESMRITLMLAGPNIPHGQLLAPQRIVNVLPTILSMAQWPYDPSQLDGDAITGIYQ